MKKLLCSVVMLLMLCGCQVHHEQLKSELVIQLNEWAKQEPIAYTTMQKPLYSYYLPKDVGRIESNAMSSVLLKDNVKFIMNFNPNKIVIHDYYHASSVKYYKEIEMDTEASLFFDGKGSFLGSDRRYHDYECRIVELENENYLLFLDMSYVNFSAVLKAVQIQPVIHSMFEIAKSVQYDSKEIVSAYSLRSSSEAAMMDLEDFNEELPENGSLFELKEKSDAQE